MTARVGDKEVRLECQVDAPNRRETQYYWLKNNQTIDRSTPKYNTKFFRYLKVKDIKQSDEGEYTCVAFNDAGKIQRRMHLFVKGNINMHVNLYIKRTSATIFLLPQLFS